MTETQRPAPMGGLWSLTGGAVAITVLLILLNPVTSPEGCSNYGAAGNASAFADPMWDLYLPAILLGWTALVAAEQATPPAWQNRTPWVITARALGFIMLAGTASCMICLPLLIMCH